MGFVQQVEKQEKKKTPKGRAKKRLQYTRRFVNVTLTGGKRKVQLVNIVENLAQELTVLMQMNPNPTS